MGPKGADLALPKQRIIVREDLRALNQFQASGDARTFPVAPLSVNVTLTQPWRDVVRTRNFSPVENQSKYQCYNI